jgi:acyl-[acyl-carrier-protein] desaturase
MDIALSAERLEVMQHIGKDLDGLMSEYLKPIEENWQPSDFLPDSSDENFCQRS